METPMGPMTEQAIAELVAKLKAENEALRNRIAKAGNRKLSLKVTEKGGVSVYGLGRFPVSLYKSQWLKLLGAVDEIREFLEENDERLAVKE